MIMTHSRISLLIRWLCAGEPISVLSLLYLRAIQQALTYGGAFHKINMA